MAACKSSEESNSQHTIATMARSASTVWTTVSVPRAALVDKEIYLRGENFLYCIEEKQGWFCGAVPSAIFELPTNAIEHLICIISPMKAIKSPTLRLGFFDPHYRRSPVRLIVLLAASITLAALTRANAQ